MELSTETDLIDAAHDGVIYGSVIISGNQIKILKGVGVIKGGLTIASSSCFSLGDLREITGDFWLWCYGGTPRITSLENLTRVGGKLEARSTRLKDIGKLEYVGGDCKLNGTNISSLGSLRYVGGDLYLPSSFKYHLSSSLSSVQVCGITRYFKGSNIPTPSRIDNLTEYEEKIPKFNLEYNNHDGISPPSSEEAQLFFKTFKDAFVNGLFFDVDYNLNYVDWLIDNLYNDYLEHRTVSLFYHQLETIRDHYGYRGILEKITKYHQRIKGLENDNAEEKEYRRAEPYINFAYELRWYEILVKRPLMNAEHGIAIGRKDKITQFGIDHLEDIKPIFEKLIRNYEKRKKSAFLDVYFTGELPYKDTGDGVYNPRYYKKFYHSEEKYNKYLNKDATLYFPWNGRIDRYQYGMVEHAVSETLAYLLREAEDLYREGLGIPRIEEKNKGPVREKELYSKLVSAFPKERVVLHGRPKWLGDQHIDIYFEDYNFGIEYHGLQHYQPVDYFGGEEAFDYRKMLDEKKQQLCKENRCEMMYVNESTPESSIFDWIQTQIKERG